ncbi:MAG: ATP-binding cassette, subfamily bacterial [Frankiaceae bacterium]|nr:ATP-binding cassette, subfamily bacterial [Frankiaceae bacterium]
MTTASTSRVAWRLLRNDVPAYALGWTQWVAFHSAPLAVGWCLKVILDRLTGGAPGVPWLLLAVLLGIEAGRWALFVSAVLQWHGAWVGWQTVPRVNALTALATAPGPAVGRLPSSPGEAVSRFRDDVEDVALVLDVWLDVSGALVSSAVAVAIMAAIDLRAALAVAVPIAAALFGSVWLGPRLREWRRSAREATAAVTSFIGDTFGGVLAVKTAGAEAAVDRRFADLNALRATVARRDQVGTELVRSLGYGTGEVTVGIVLLLVAAGFRRGALSVGDIGLFATYVVSVISGLPKWVGRMGAYHRQADVSVDRLAELMPSRDRMAAVQPVRTYLRHGPPALARPAAASEPFDALTVSGLTVRHPGSEQGVTGVDLVVRRGELVVVTGRVGAGKSTLLRGVLGLLAAEGGTVSWNGAAVADPSTFLVPPRVAYLPQVPRLFSEALAETILLGLPAEGLDEAVWLACLDGDVAAMPEGVATVIGPRGLRLSGGQVQRAAAARAFVRRPDLVVVDDISSALDVDTETRLWERFVAGGYRSALLVSHRPHVLDIATRVVVLDGGRVVSS